jgi:acetyl-CoA synthetase
MTETHPDAPSSYPPPAEFVANANATADLYREAESDRLAFWAEQAHRLSWATPFSDVLDWSGAPVAKWFVGGTLNVAYNCVDRHVESGHGNQVALHFEGEPGDGVCAVGLCRVGPASDTCHAGSLRGKRRQGDNERHEED